MLEANKSAVITQVQEAKAMDIVRSAQSQSKDDDNSATGNLGVSLMGYQQAIKDAVVRTRAMATAAHSKLTSSVQELKTAIATNGFQQHHPTAKESLFRTIQQAQSSIITAETFIKSLDKSSKAALAFANIKV